MEGLEPVESLVARILRLLVSGWVEARLACRLGELRVGQLEGHSETGALRDRLDGERLLGLDRSRHARRFYEQLGWRGQEVEETVFFQAGNIGVVLWGRDKLAQDSGVDDTGTDGFGGMALAHNVRSSAEVDAFVATAAEAGATITRPPSETFYGGYAGCFTDPDGHVWEVAHNPGFALDGEGAITIPDFGADA